MTARDERLEAVLAIVSRADPDVSSWDIERFILAYDAVRAFDEQRKEVMSRQKGMEDNPGRDNATAPADSPVGAEPPWLDALISQCFSRASGKLTFEEAQQIARAVLRFAATQPPSEAEIEEAASELVDSIIYDPELDAMTAARRVARAALLAAARVRAGG